MYRQIFFAMAASATGMIMTPSVMAQDSCTAGEIVGKGWSLRPLSVLDNGKASFNLSTGLPDSFVKEAGLRLTDAEKADNNYTSINFNGQYDPEEGTSWTGFVYTYGDIERTDGTDISSSELTTTIYVARSRYGEGSVYDMGAGMQGFFQGKKYPPGLTESYMQDGVQIDFFLCETGTSNCLSTSVRLMAPSTAMSEAAEIMKTRSEKKVATGSCS